MHVHVSMSTVVYVRPESVNWLQLHADWSLPQRWPLWRLCAPRPTVAWAFIWLYPRRDRLFACKRTESKLHDRSLTVQIILRGKFVKVLASRADSLNSSLSRRLSSAGYVQTNLIRLELKTCESGFLWSHFIFHKVRYRLAPNPEERLGKKKHVSDIL